MRIAFLWGLTVSSEHTGNEWLKEELNLEFQTQYMDFFQRCNSGLGLVTSNCLSGSASCLSSPAVNWTLSQGKRVYCESWPLLKPLTHPSVSANTCSSLWMPPLQWTIGWVGFAFSFLFIYLLCIAFPFIKRISEISYTFFYSGVVELII